MNKDIDLLPEQAFARGGNRLCFVDPRDMARCIKVQLPDRSPTYKRSKASFLKRLRPLGYYDDNLRELSTYQRLESFLGEDDWLHLPKCYGMVETSLGAGIVTDLVRDFDGSISGCLKTKLRESGNDPEFRSAVKQFEAFLIQTGFPTRDLLLHNLVAQNLDAAGNFKIVVIDGFGSADILPFVYWSKVLARRKVIRKIERFHGKIEEFVVKYSIPYHP